MLYLTSVLFEPWELRTDSSLRHDADYLAFSRASAQIVKSGHKLKLKLIETNFSRYFNSSEFAIGLHHPSSHNLNSLHLENLHLLN